MCSKAAEIVGIEGLGLIQGTSPDQQRMQRSMLAQNSNSFLDHLLSAVATACPDGMVGWHKARLHALPA